MPAHEDGQLAAVRLTPENTFLRVALRPRMHASTAYCEQKNQGRWVQVCMDGEAWSPGPSAGRASRTLLPLIASVCTLTFRFAK